jgi:hypothetical protein
MSATTSARSLTVKINTLGRKFAASAPEGRKASVRVQYAGPIVNRWGEAWPALKQAMLDSVIRYGVGEFYASAMEFLTNAAWFVLMGAMAQTFKPIPGQRATELVGPGHGPSFEDNVHANGRAVAELPPSYRLWKRGDIPPGQRVSVQPDYTLLQAWDRFAAYVIRGF